MKTCHKHLAGIKDRRISAKKTQQELADDLGINRATVAMWEAGKSMPKAAMLPIIAEALSCSIDDLFRAA